MKTPAKARLIFPHQLFTDHLHAPTDIIMVLVEDDLFFTQFRFHKQKLILHRASMRSFADTLHDKGYTVVNVETSAKPSMEVVKAKLNELSINHISYYDVVDDWLQRRITKLVKDLGISGERLVTPAFLTSPGLIDEYFDHNPNRMKNFYEWQRKRLKILVEGSKPVGGQWSYDADNRKKLPKSITLPPTYNFRYLPHVDDAKTWVDKTFPDNPGNSQTFNYPVTHDQATQQLQQFITERLELFGPYEDAIAKDESQLFHSVISSSLNCGLLSPQQVIDEVLAYADKHEVSLPSLEGFIRQVIGWREYMRATYVRYGSTMRTSNHLAFDRTLSDGWWDGSTGIMPIDNTIGRVLDTAYAHHIERLMILGNSMILLRTSPDAAYEWFMSLFIDAYDWVMVPNVYTMSQFATGAMITTKPYISGSNYIIKMSDYKKGEWSQIWDALYWQFIDDRRDIIEKNYRTRMVVSLYDRFDDDKKAAMSRIASDWLLPFPNNH